MAGTHLRPLRPDDLERVAAIDALHTGSPVPETWGARMTALLAEETRATVALACVDEADDTVCGYLVAEVRSWEFGSEPAGWIFAVGVDPAHQQRSVGRALLEAAVARLRSLGVRTVRTMVRRDDLAVLRFFRSGGFVAGPYTELELEVAG